MGEIIKFPGLKKEREEEKTGQEERIDIDKATELLILLARLISNTTGSPRGEAYQAKYNLVSAYSDAEIVGWINNFDGRKVAAQPFFYSALIDVARARELFPLTHK